MLTYLRAREVGLASDAGYSPDQVVASELGEILGPLREIFEPAAGFSEWPADAFAPGFRANSEFLRRSGWSPRGGDALWQRLSALPAAALRRLHAVLVARTLRLPFEASALVQAIATSNTLRVPTDALTDDFLKGYRRPRLEVLAVESGAVSPEDMPLWQRRTAKQLRQHILEHRRGDWLPEELQFTVANAVSIEDDQYDDDPDDDAVEES